MFRKLQGQNGIVKKGLQCGQSSAVWGSQKGNGIYENQPSYFEPESLNTDVSLNSEILVICESLCPRNAKI